MASKASIRLNPNDLTILVFHNALRRRDVVDHLGEQMHRAPVALQVAILPLLGRRRWLRLDVGS